MDLIFVYSRNSLIHPFILRSKNLHCLLVRRLRSVQKSGSAKPKTLLREYMRSSRDRLQFLRQNGLLCGAGQTTSMAGAPFAHSRSFPGRIYGKSNDPVLIPGLDSINHSRGFPVTWSHQDNAVVLTLHKAVQKNTQVMNNYGAKSNEELILSYGFVEQGGPDDVLVLRLRDGDTHYWHYSDVRAPTALVHALSTKIATESDEAPLEREARIYELLEEFLIEKRRVFRYSQREFEYNEAYSRPHIAGMIHEYRQGQSNLLNHAIQAIRTRLEELVDELE